MNHVSRHQRPTNITRLALIATATIAAAIVFPAIAQADDSWFQTPSGNIQCVTSLGRKGNPFSLCTVGHSDYAVPPGHCQFPGPVRPQFELGQGETPDLSCVTGDQNPAWPTLDYGQTRSVGTITCESEPSGVTCTDSSTGHFFGVSQESYQLG